MSGVDIAVVQGDLLLQDTDLIVNPANGNLLHGGGLAAKIASTAGEDLIVESDRKGLIPVGGAVATTAGLLPFRAVIHAVGPVWGGGSFHEADLLAKAHRSALEVASKLATSYGESLSIGFPAISCGIFGYPVGLAAPVAVGAAKHGMFPGVGAIKFVLFGDDHFKAFSAALGAISR